MPNIMAPEETLLDAVDRLDRLVKDLRDILWGNATTRTNGLLNEVDSLKSQVARLESKVNALEARRENRVVWSVAYVSFALAVLFAILGAANLGGHNLFDVPAGFALALAGFFVIVALPAFWAGFGWLR